MKKEDSSISAIFQKNAKSRALLKRIRAYDTWFRLILDKELETVKHQGWERFGNLEVQEQKGWAIGNLVISKTKAEVMDMSDNQKYIYQFIKEGFIRRNCRRQDRAWLHLQSCEELLMIYQIAPCRS